MQLCTSGFEFCIFAVLNCTLNPSSMAIGESTWLNEFDERFFGRLDYTFGQSRRSQIRRQLKTGEPVVLLRLKGAQV